jgi:hypothetical protein
MAAIPGTTPGVLLNTTSNLWSPKVTFSYADAAARTGATGLTSEDVAKIALQIDTGTYWLLADITPTWIQIVTGSIPSVPQWNTLLDMDFTAQTSGDFSADGTVVIGGVSFIVENFANLYAGATMGVVFGSGLKLGCQSSGTNYTTARNSPLLRWPFPSDVINNVPVRACVYVGTDSGWTGELYLGFEYPSSSPRDNQWVMAGVSAGTSVASTYGFGYSTNSTATTLISNNTVNTNTTLLGMFAHKSIGSVHIPDVLAGKYADGAYVNMNQLSPIYTPTTAIQNATIAPTTVGQAQNWGIAISSRFGSLGATYRVYCQRVKVQAFY